MRNMISRHTLESIFHLSGNCQFFLTFPFVLYILDAIAEPLNKHGRKPFFPNRGIEQLKQIVFFF